MRRLTVPDAAIPLLWCIAFAFLVWRAPGEWLDDAFILFRYARHIGLGLGPVWNAHESPTEGYTSFLYVMLMALPGRWGWDLPFLSLWVNLIAGWACLVALYWGLRLWGWNHWIAGVLCGCLALNPFVVRHVSTGMETTLYMFLLTAFFFLLGSTAQKAKPEIAFAVGFLAALTRPEAVAAVSCAFAVGCVLLSAAERKRFIRAFVWYFLLPGLCYMTWRVWVFGDIFPNPHYIKQAEGWISLLGMGYVLRFFGGAVFPFFLLACWQIVRISLPDPRAWPAFAAGAICLFYALFFCSVTPLMGEDFRFLVPILPLLFYLCASGVETMLGALPGYRRALLALCFLAFGYISQPEHLIGAIRPNPSPGAQLLAVETRLGQLLHPFHADAPLVAWGDAGALAYYSEWRFLDTVGLNDNFIARSHRKPLSEVLDYVFDAHPTLILLPGHPGVAPSETTIFTGGHGPHGKAIYRGLFQDRRLNAYAYAATFETPIYNLHAFVRRDATMATSLLDELRRTGTVYGYAR